MNRAWFLAASSASLWTPVELVRSVSSLLFWYRGGLAGDARLYTVSIFVVGSSSVVMSAVMISRLGVVLWWVRLLGVPEVMLSMTMTFSPRRSRASVRWLPRNPAPPATSVVVIFSVGSLWWVGGFLGRCGPTGLSGASGLHRRRRGWRL